MAQKLLSTLNDATLISGDLIGTLGEDFYWISADLVWDLMGNTQGEGPIAVGVAHGDLSDAEIEEAIEVSLLDPSDIIARERARRPVRHAGMFSVLGVNETLNDGKPIRTKCKFSVASGKTLRFWAYNFSGATLTDGANVRVTGKLYGRWQI